jgi:hypothetical protein
MPGSEQPHIDYYFRKERPSDNGAHERIVGALPKPVDCSAISE